MAHSTFGSSFKDAYLASSKAEEDRRKAKKLHKRTTRAREDLLRGRIGGYSPEAYKQLTTERGIEGAPGKPLEALMARVEGSKRRDRLRELSSQEAALARISKRLAEDRADASYLTRAEEAESRALETWKTKLGITTELEKGETLESRQLSFAASAGSAGMEWEEFTAGNDLEATRDATNPQWMSFKGAREKMLGANRTEQANIKRNAYHSYAFRKGQLRDQYGKPVPLERDILAMYPTTGILHKSGSASTELEEQVTGRRIDAGIEGERRRVKLADEEWLQSPERFRMDHAFTKLWKKPAAKRGGLKPIPSRGVWDKSLKGLIGSGYARLVTVGANKGDVVPTDRWMKFFRKDPERFNLYTQYIEMTGKVPALGTTSSTLKRELGDLASDIGIMTTAISANAVRGNLSLTEVGVEVDKLINAGSLKKNQRSAVMGMVMKDVRTEQYADALRAGRGERAYTDLMSVVAAGMASDEMMLDGRPRWVIVTKQKEDADGNPIMVGEHFPHPKAALDEDDLKKISVKLNNVGIAGRAGLPKKHTLESGKDVIIQKLDD